MGGPSTNNQQAIEQQQVNTSNQANAISQQEYQQQQQLEAPAIGFYQGLINGAPGATNSAAAPLISNITQGQNAAIETIKNTVPQGAGQQYALSQVPIQENSQIASTLNNVTTGAYSSLANIGAGLGSNSIQELGATLSGLSGASSTGSSVLQAQNQAKASTLGVFGSLLGAGGEAAGGFLSNPNLYA